MQLELAEYNDNRTKEYNSLLKKQREDLAHFNAEIGSLGVNVSEINDSLQDIHFYAAQAATQLTPSNLQRSYSSNPFQTSTK